MTLAWEKRFLNLQNKSFVCLCFQGGAERGRVGVPESHRRGHSLSGQAEEVRVRKMCACDVRCTKQRVSVCADVRRVVL